MPSSEELATFLRLAIQGEKYVARGGLTFCNHFVQDTFDYFGYKGFKGLTANQIFEKCLGSPEFEEQQPEECAWLVHKYGYLVVAASIGKPHGHVAVVFPGVPVYSGKLACHVPMVASTGEPNRIAGANWFFRGMPRFFKLKEQVD